MLSKPDIEELMDVLPERAIEIVRTLGNSPEEKKLKADIYIDAGFTLNRSYLVRAGICILKNECRVGNGTAAHHYSLANGLSAYSEIYDGVNQSEKSRARLDSEARAYYGNALASKEYDFQLRSQAATNIANHLNKRGRYIEAIDYYDEALRVMPVNAVAAAGELSLLKQLGYLIHHEDQWYSSYGEFPTLLRRTIFLRDVIKDNLDVMKTLAGSDHIDYAMGLIKDTPDFDLPKEIDIQDTYEKWVAENRLALSLFCSGEEYNNKRYDLLIVPNFIADETSGNRPPDVFRMINILKSDYLLARRLVFEALNEQFTETANYSDTLDYATYGINISALASAQKTAIDILDKISVVLAVLLKLPSPEFFQFKKQSFWRKEKSTGQWILKHDEVERQILAGNSTMAVFMDILSDLYGKGDGYLSHLTSLRNFATHRFLTIHDFSFTPKAEDKEYVGHFQQYEFTEGAMKSLRLARACIFYLVDFIKILEDQKKRDTDLMITFDVPDHHWIRGQD